MDKPLSGKVALVTGGSRGIGAAIARELARLGANVAISYAQNAERANEVLADIGAAGVTGASFRADQADIKAGARLVDEVIAAFGRLDILVNNAGVFEVGGVDAADSAEGLARLLAVNVAGTLAITQAASKVMADAGRIISISSAAATRAGVPGLAGYAASKAALEGYSKGAARDLGKRGITVNALAVGPIETDMNPKDTDFAGWLQAQTSLGRYGQATEVAAVIGFLATPAAGFVTGAVIAVDGGLNA